MQWTVDTIFLGDTIAGGDRSDLFDSADGQDQFQICIAFGANVLKESGLVVTDLLWVGLMMRGLDLPWP